MAGNPPINLPESTIPSEWLLASVKVIETQQATLFGEFIDVSRADGRLRAAEWLSELVLKVVAERDKILSAYEQERLKRSVHSYADGMNGIVTNNGSTTTN